MHLLFILFFHTNKNASYIIIFYTFHSSINLLNVIPFILLTPLMSYSLHTFIDNIILSYILAHIIHTIYIGINIEILRIWYQTYLQVMSMPALKSCLYEMPIPLDEEAKFNIMHCTFVMIHIHQTPDDDVLIKGSQVFATLLQTYLETNLNVCVCVCVF